MLTTRNQSGPRPKKKTKKKTGVKESTPRTTPIHASHLGSARWRTAEIPVARIIVPRPTGKKKNRSLSIALIAWVATGLMLSAKSGSARWIDPATAAPAAKATAPPNATAE